MWERIKEWVCRYLGIEPIGARRSPDDAVRRYEDISRDNITATIANKLAMLALADSALTITDTLHASPNMRVQLIHDVLAELWESDAAWCTAQALGKGGKVIVPTVCSGRLRLNIIDHNRMYIRAMDGRRITAATLAADTDTVNGQRMYLMLDYALENGVQLIRAGVRTSTGALRSLESVPRWADISPEISIANTDRLLFAYLRCPRDDRTDEKALGVPITYGAETLMDELAEHVRIYRREYRLTRPMLGLDAALWQDPSAPGERPGNIARLRRTVQDGDDPFVPVEGAALSDRSVWQYYAPAIRCEAMETRYQSLCRRVEKACGLSQGILTERQSVNYANRDEVRAAMYDTYSVVTAIRGAWERALKDLAYAVDVLAERFALTPQGSCGQYTLSVDWDTSLIESTSEAYRQNAELQAAGGLSLAELRQWVRGGTLEDAEKAVKQIADERPDPVRSILDAAGYE